MEHSFRYHLFMLYLDLDELDRVFSGRWLWSTARPNLAWFRRQDHFGSVDRSLAESARELVRRELGWSPEGPIRLLTHLRYFGYVMNPLSLYYCFDRTGERVRAVIAEVTNTPWEERHCYVLPANEVPSTSRGEFLRYQHPKAFHVSPFLPMDLEYRWTVSPPGESLGVQLEDLADGRTVFDATLNLMRRPITGGQLAAALLRHPWMTGRVISAIYWQALRLYLKRVPYFPHPKVRGLSDVPSRGLSEEKR